MIIEFHKQVTNYNLDFCLKYIEEVINIAAEKVFKSVYPDKTEFSAILPEGVCEANIKALINITFVDDAEIRQLNLSQRNIDQSTDVLSFPLLDMHEGRFLQLGEFDFYPEKDEPNETDESNKNSGLNTAGEANTIDNTTDAKNTADDLDDFADTASFILELGDVVISVPTAIKQATEYNHSFTREICFLSLHGFLHVVGFDHEESRSAEELMFKIQDEVLNLAGISRAFPDEQDVLQSVEKKVDSDSEFKCGYIAILGRPNAGKSTLLNRLSGDELAITSPKAKTTRHNIKAVLDDGQSQLIFIDTPGIERSSNQLERYMTSSAWGALEIADVVLLLVDAKHARITEVEEVAFKKAKELALPIVLVLTKVDVADKERMLPVIAKYTAKFEVDDVVPISAVKDDNIDVLLDVIRNLLPVRPRLYSEDAYTDQSEKALAAEYIREEILHMLYQEVPHDVAVNIDKFAERYDEQGVRKVVVIEATILVNRSSQKGIIIGKGGKMIKRIGIASREKLEKLYDAKVYLELFVRVQEDWKNSSNVLTDLGYVEGKNGPAENDIIE